jgi:hypothetical protein
MKTTLNNFIPLNRKLFKHEFWLQNRIYSRFEAWLDLITSARYDNTEARMLIGSHVVRWNRGELVASLRYLGERWGWKLNKVNTFINLLKNESMIKTRTANGTVQTIVTICNYDIYNTFSQISKQQNKQLENSLQTVEEQLENSLQTVEEQLENKTNIENIEQQSKQREIYRGFAHLILFTDEYFKLIDLGYTQTQINQVLDAIENYKNNKKYTSLYLTAKKWLAQTPQVAAGAGRIVNIADAFNQALQYG